MSRRTRTAGAVFRRIGVLSAIRSYQQQRRLTEVLPFARWSVPRRHREPAGHSPRPRRRAALRHWADVARATCDVATQGGHWPTAQGA